MSRKPISHPLFQAILVAVDFSECSNAAFQVACSLAREGTTRLIVMHVAELVHVVEQPVGFGDTGAPVFVAGEGWAYGESLRERLSEVYTPAIPVEVEYLVGEGAPADEILRVAEERHCDLIVMGSHGRTGLERVLVGSIAESVLRRARCPVSTVRTLSPVPDPAAVPGATTVTA